MQNVCISFNVAYFLSTLHQIRLLYYHLSARLHKVRHVCIDREEEKYYIQVGARPKSQTNVWKRIWNEIFIRMNNEENIQSFASLNFKVKSIFNRSRGFNWCVCYTIEHMHVLYKCLSTCCQSAGNDNANANTKNTLTFAWK